MTAYISAARWDCINRSDPARGTRKRNPPFSWSMKIGSSGWQPMSACIQGLAAGYRVTFCDESSDGSSARSICTGTASSVLFVGGVQNGIFWRVALAIFWRMYGEVRQSRGGVARLSFVLALVIR